VSTFQKYILPSTLAVASLPSTEKATELAIFLSVSMLVNGNSCAKTWPEKHSKHTSKLLKQWLNICFNGMYWVNNWFVFVLFLDAVGTTVIRIVFV
jgi:hypothetical protein